MRDNHPRTIWIVGPHLRCLLKSINSAIGDVQEVYPLPSKNLINTVTKIYVRSVNLAPGVHGF
jgi:hypothetical protein